MSGRTATGSLATAQRAHVAITKAIEVLEVFPFSCRKALGAQALRFCES